MTCRALWNATNDESFHSDVLSEIDFMSSTKESENKDTECVFCNGKFFEDERTEIWIKSFSCSLWAHWECTGAQNAGMSVTFKNRLEAGMVFIQP